SIYNITVDHINSPTIGVGDTVTAGQKIGTAGNINGTNPSPYGLVELQINQYTVGSSCNDSSKFSTVCPFVIFDPNLLSTNKAKITQLMADWESLKANTGIYDEASMSFPGCIVNSF